jgi:hypothetical protein
MQLSRMGTCLVKTLVKGFGVPAEGFDGQGADRLSLS